MATLRAAMVLRPQSFRSRKENVQTENWARECPVRSSAKSRLEIPGYQLQALAAHSSAKERRQLAALTCCPGERARIPTKVHGPRSQ
jgi:hypothetical protein